MKNPESKVHLHEENEIQGIRVTAPSRLSFTLIDLNGNSGRRNGMASLAIQKPSFNATVRRSEGLSIILDEHANAHSEAINDYVETLCRQYSIRNISIKVDDGLPPNCGFGSKTTTLLALGKAITILDNLVITTGELAKIARRGGTSGGSVNLIDRGGFLVDGGHENPPDFCNNSNEYLVPSRYAPVTTIPPVLINIPFPSWPILVMIPNGNKTFGKRELEWFREVVPIPESEAHKTAHLVLMNLSTSVAEKRYAAFCKAVNDVTNNTFFKQKQIENQNTNVKNIIKEARSQFFVDAVGMSSMGPMCYVFSKNLEELIYWAESKRNNGTISSYWLTEAQNRPALFEKF